MSKRIDNNNIRWNEAVTNYPYVLAAKKTTYVSLIIFVTGGIATGFYFLSKKFTDKWWLETPASFTWIVGSLVVTNYHLKKRYERAKVIPTEQAMIHGRTPASATGMAASSLILGPLFFCTKNWDFTKYHDPDIANDITKDLRKYSFEDISKTYGNRFHKLIRYGFIESRHKPELDRLHRTEKEITKKLAKFRETDVSEAKNLPMPHPPLSKNMGKILQLLNARKENEAAWKQLKAEIHPKLPEP